MRFSDWADDPRKTSRWQRFRLVMLGRYPICERCGIRVAEEVHHLVSVRLARHLAYDVDSVRCLCGSCHDDAHRGEISYRPRRQEAPPGV
jgi:5-methylcytosine-specific restriction endonuclease McrA